MGTVHSGSGCRGWRWGFGGWWSLHHLGSLGSVLGFLVFGLRIQDFPTSCRLHRGSLVLLQGNDEQTGFATEFNSSLWWMFSSSLVALDCDFRCMRVQGILDVLPQRAPERMGQLAPSDSISQVLKAFNLGVLCSYTKPVSKWFMCWFLVVYAPIQSSQLY